MSGGEECIQIEGLSLEELLQLHLNSKESCPWTVQNSQLHGQGLFAAREIEDGEVIFHDIALVRGPRSGPSKDPLCVGCLSSSTPLRPCSRLCHLPVCSNHCENSLEHRAECEFLRKYCQQRNDLTDTNVPHKQNDPLVNKGLVTEMFDHLTTISPMPITQQNKPSITGDSIKGVCQRTEETKGQYEQNVFDFNGVRQGKEDISDFFESKTNCETTINVKSEQRESKETERNQRNDSLVEHVNGHRDRQDIDGPDQRMKGSIGSSTEETCQPHGLSTQNINGLEGLTESEQCTSIQAQPSDTPSEGCALCGDINLELVRAVTPLRCLQMSKLKQRIMRALESIEHPVCEIDILKRHLSLPLPLKTETYLRGCCGTLDTNAYGGTGHGKILNFRGLYALSAIMNHSCAPNTTYFFDSHSRMVVKAVRRIYQGEEILSTYTSLLWGTATRRSFLNSTKNFLCRCERCRDPTEFGTRLSGINCKAKPCAGVLLPSNPLDVKSDWICDSGHRQHKIGAQKAFQVLNICSKVAEMLTQNEDVGQIRTFLKRVPENAQSANQIRKHFVLHTKGVMTDFSDEKLLFKEESCVKLLDLIAMLKLGGNYLRGLILQELHLVLQEKLRRFGDTKVDPEAFGRMKIEYETILSS